MLPKKIARISPNRTIFFLCDLQSTFEKKIHNMPLLLHTASKLSKISAIFNIPLLVTEHYPKAFGRTIESLKPSISASNSTFFDKTLFSMVTEETSNFLEKHEGKDTIVLFGIEAHVCVQQTTLDLLERGYNVHLVLDGVSSIREHDRNVAIKRLSEAGAVTTTSESLIFELMRDAKHPKFKEVLEVIKEERPDTKFPNL